VSTPAESFIEFLKRLKELDEAIKTLDQILKGVSLVTSGELPQELPPPPPPPVIIGGRREEDSLFGYEEDINRTADALKEASKIKDLNKGILYLIASAKSFDCPLCRALHIHMIEHLLRYEKIRREKEGKPTEDVERLMRELPEKLKKELLVTDEQYNKSLDKFEKILREAYDECEVCGK